MEGKAERVKKDVEDKLHKFKERQAKKPKKEEQNKSLKSEFE